MAIGDLIKDAEIALEKNDLELAMVKIDAALKQNDKSIKSLIIKARINNNLKNYDESIELLNKSYALTQISDFKKQENLIQIFELYSIVYFKLKKFQESYSFILQCLNYCKSYKNDKNELNSIVMMKAMIENKLKKMNIDYKAIKPYEFDKIQETDISKSGHSNEIGDLSITENKEQVETTTSSTTPVSPPTTTITKKNNDLKIDWFDNKKTVEISIFVKNIQKDNLLVKFNQDSVSVEFKIKSNHTPLVTSYEYNLNPLYDSIIPESCKFNLFKTKLELILFKQSLVPWKSLEKSSDSKEVKTFNTLNEEADTENTTTITSNSNPLAYPSSSKKKIDWSKIDTLDGDDGDAETADNQDPDDFFKQLYSNADDDTRRAMMKSYVESNGTALSTDWSEVSKKKVETSPPTGMEARSFN
ncbi:unnamed protein product [[Candida] boidinii]|uniref:Unnamed protein product n=1 Tax=Candida boidinii TaxID=5477 RepID=A0A9W6T0L8_CANBO|nr:hypothetical protein B5S30_g1926 [[Candida] boidinii]OWB86551.1 hypothetical protein B5S33_g5252 [[Candida] boidinii]GME68647.1 unnamed protein product [[Candida] boidinii]